MHDGLPPAVRDALNQQQQQLQPKQDVTVRDTAGIAMHDGLPAAVRYALNQQQQLQHKQDVAVGCMVNLSHNYLI